MASTLFGRAPKDSYQELLKLDNTGAGIDGTLRSILDGAGNATPLQISSTQVSLNGSVWPTAAGTTGQNLTVGASGLTWTTPTSLVYKSAWNAATNTPSLISGTGTTGALYKVSTAGTSVSHTIPNGISGGPWTSYAVNGTSGIVVGMGATDQSSGTFLGIVVSIGTNSVTFDRATGGVFGGPFNFYSYLDGITTFNVGDYVFFDGTAWERIAGSGSAPVQSVFGRTGAVTMQSSDVTTALGFTPANTASPALTGTPTAPTATAGTNTTQIATTAFVSSAVNTATGFKYAAVYQVNTSTALDATYYGSLIQLYGSTALTITLPALSSATTGQTLSFESTATSTITINQNAADSSAIIYYNATPVSSVTLQVGDTLTITRNGNNWVVSNGTVAMINSGSATAKFATKASPTLTGRAQSDAYSYTVSALGNVSGTKTIDLSTASEFTATITGTTTFAFTNTLGANNGQVVYFRLTNAGSAQINWPTGTKFSGGTPPSYTTSGVDLLGIMYDVTTSTYMVFVIGLNIQ